jgi:sugar lactone lactonase YvrE
MRAELVDDAGAALGEGPLWDADGSVLHWLDIDGATWHRWSVRDGRLPLVQLDQTPGFLALQANGGLVAGVETGFARLADDGTLTMLATVETRTDHRMNDGEADPSGRLWGSTMARSCDRPTGALWRVDLDGTAHVALPDVTIGNGLAFTEDGAGMWFVDSATRSVDRLEVDPATGDLSGRRSVVRFADHEEPDGLCVDADGGLWVAVWNGWSVRRYDAAGRETARVEVPAAQVTSCAFGGADLDQLFITTAAKGTTDQPLAGGLFVTVPGATGRAPYPCSVKGGAPRSSSAGM